MMLDQPSRQKFIRHAVDTATLPASGCMTPGQGNATAKGDELVRGLKTAKDSAVQELFQRFQAKAYAICLGILKNDADAREAAQEALEQVTRNIAKFDGQSSFSTWFSRVVINAALMRQRKQSGLSARLVPLEFLDENAPHASATIDTASPPDRQLITSDSVRTLELLCARLPKACCPLVALVDFQGRTVPEAATALGLSVASAKSRLLRGRAQLRQLICDLGELCGPWCGLG